MRRNRAREEALAWLARLKRGLRQGEGPQLLSWLRRPSHRKLIAKAALEWHGPEVLAVLSELFPIDPPSFEPRRGRHPAFIAAAVVAGILVSLEVPTPIDVLLGIRPHVYTSAVGATKRLDLEDGTRVELNRGTQINVLYAEHIRTVVVARGEALFRVANEPQRTFHVDVGGRWFETTSATFDIRLAPPDSLSITVLKGEVTVFPLWGRRRADGHYERVVDPIMKHPVLLEPLQMLTIEPDEESGQMLTEKDVRSRLSWQGGT